MVNYDSNTFYIDTSNLSELDVFKSVTNIIYLPQTKKRKEITFQGAPCTGKTTICKKIAEYYQEPYINEFTRTYIETNNNNLNKFTVEMFNCLTKQQLEMEKLQLKCVNKYLFVDNGPASLLVFFDSETVRKLALKQLNYAFINFLCDNSISYVADGTRPDNEEISKKAQNIIKRYMDENNAKYIILTGDVQKRMNSIIYILKKYDNFDIPHDYESVLENFEKNNIRYFD